MNEVGLEIFTACVFCNPRRFNRKKAKWHLTAIALIPPFVALFNKHEQPK